MNWQQLSLDQAVEHARTHPEPPLPSFSSQVAAQHAAECPREPKFTPPKGKMAKLLQVMKGGKWWPPLDLCPLTGISPLCITSRIRDLRKEEYGGHNVIWNESSTKPLYRLVSPSA